MTAPQTTVSDPDADSVTAVSPAEDVRPMARALLARALGAFPHVPAAARAPAHAAIDAFVAAPSPTRFLAAVRVLVELRRGISIHALRVRGSVHAFERGLEALRALPSLDGGLVDALAKLPVDLETGPRLRGLATLLGVTEQLTRAADAASERHREAIGLPSAEIALAVRGRLLGPAKKKLSTGPAPRR